MSKLSRTDLVRETKVEIRSLLLTCRLGIPFTKLDKDYQLFNGKRIDFRSMGYSSLREFIDDIPDVASQNFDSDGFLVLHAVADDTTQHIASLVARTKVIWCRSLRSSKGATSLQKLGIRNPNRANFRFEGETRIEDEAREERGEAQGRGRGLGKPLPRKFLEFQLQIVQFGV